MKYFFKDENDQYFNPLNGVNELYGFSVETIGVQVYTHWLDGRFPQTLSDDCFIDLDKYTVQFVNVVFLCILQDDSGLYLDQNFCMTKTPFVWHYKPDKDNELNNKLFAPNYYHELYLSLSLTCKTKSIEDFYKLNKYINFNDICKYTHKFSFVELFILMDKIHPITHILKMGMKTKDGNAIVKKEGPFTLWKRHFKLDIFEGSSGHDYFSNHFNFDNDDYVYSSFSHNDILICATDDVFLAYTHKKIPRNKLKSLKIS